MLRPRNHVTSSNLDATPGTGSPEPRDERRDPARSLDGCHRVLVVGRTGSGKTTLARQLAPALGAPHVELDSLHFTVDLDTVPQELLRERTQAAVAAPAWVTDGNKRAVRDLVWPRADTLVWLDYPLIVSLWRLSRRALRRAEDLRARSAGGDASKSTWQLMTSAARGVMTALRSHRGQRSEFPHLLGLPEHRHLAVVRLRSPRATTRWLEQVAGVPTS